MLTEMSDFPSYAPLKIVPSFSKEVLGVAASDLFPYSHEDLITFNGDSSIHDQHKLLTNFLNLDSYNVNRKLPDGSQIQGHYQSFRSLNLTYLPDYPDSRQNQFYYTPEKKLGAYLFIEDGAWQWRDDLNIKPFITFVDSLGFTNIHLVRLVYLSPPAVGGVHIDTSPSSMQKYYVRGGVSMTFNLRSAGSSLHFIKNNKIYSIPPELSAWHFDPSVPHSVGFVNSQRIQLRIFGEMPKERYLENLDMESAV